MKWMNCWDCTKNFLKIFKQELFSYWLQLLTSLIQANFLLVAWYGSMLLYWSRSAKPTGSKFSFSLNGRDSSDLLYPSLFLPFTWTSYSESNSLSPFYSFGQNYSKSNSFFLLLFGQKYSKSKLPLLVALLGKKNLSPTPNPQKYSKTFSFSVLVANPFQSYKSVLSHTFFLTFESSLALLTYSILLPLESEQCPLTPASVLACADSVDELRFWSKSES